jgi:hypothetical protein
MYSKQCAAEEGDAAAAAVGSSIRICAVVLSLPPSYPTSPLFFPPSPSLHSSAFDRLKREEEEKEENEEEEDEKVGDGRRRRPHGRTSIV